MDIRYRARNDSFTKHEGPRPPPVEPKSPPGCSDRTARVPPPCFIGRPVHRLSRSTPVDGSLPYFADLASDTTGKSL